MSQADQILALLRDRRPHSTAELLQAVPSVVHSRISDLRKRGHAIRHDTTGPGAEGSLYTLIATAEEVADANATLAELEQSETTPSGGSSSASTAPQLPAAFVTRAGTKLAGEATDGTPGLTPSPAAPHSIEDVVAILERHGLVELPPFGDQPDQLFENAA